MFRWVSMTAFGSPVVPLEDGSRQTSSGSMSVRRWITFEQARERRRAARTVERHHFPRLADLRTWSILSIWSDEATIMPHEFFELPLEFAASVERIDRCNGSPGEQCTVIRDWPVERIGAEDCEDFAGLEPQGKIPTCSAPAKIDDLSKCARCSGFSIDERDFLRSPGCAHRRETLVAKPSGIATVWKRTSEDGHDVFPLLVRWPCALMCRWRPGLECRVLPILCRFRVRDIVSVTQLDVE